MFSVSSKRRTVRFSGRQANRRSTCPLRIEYLEPRRLLAAVSDAVPSAALFEASAFDAAMTAAMHDYETDQRLLHRFHGPVIPGNPIRPIQGVAVRWNDLPDDDYPTHADPPTNASPGDTNASPGESPSAAGPFPDDQTFKLHSRPESNFTIYLDFDGHTTVGTSWNVGYGLPVIVHPNYWGETGANFSASRLELIQKIWQVVAEDFAAFDVNVTTEEPSDLDDLRYNGSQDTRWGTRAVMTKDTFANCSCGGHAYLGSFDDSQDEPALVYNSGLNAGSETVSHEVGHQLGLNHDGVGSTTYYSGHGSGVTGWGPIMGAPFSKQVTQWNHGDYFNANRTNEDDLAVITRSVNFPYASDDHANDRLNASQLNESAGTTVEAFGIIERNDDVDWFRFSTGGGDVSFAVDVLDNKPNLDVWVGLFDADGNFIADANPQSSLDATLQPISLDPGVYFLKVDGVGRDQVYDPLLDTHVEPSPPPYAVANPLGYSDYGSLGQYRISGSIVDAGIASVSIIATTSVVTEGDEAVFLLQSSDAGSVDVTVEVVRVRQSAPGQSAPRSTDPADFGAPVLQTVPIVNGIGSFSILLLQDGIVETNESFAVRIADSGSYAVANRVARMEVLESDTLLALVAVDSVTTEGDPPDGAVHQFMVNRSGSLAEISSVGWRRIDDGANPTDALDFQSADSGTVVFAAGETSQPLDILIRPDLDVEGDEDYRIEIFALPGQTFHVDPAFASAAGRIINDDVLSTGLVLRGLNNQLILPGDSSTSTTNGTDFGLVHVDSGIKTNVFTIQNISGSERRLSELNIQSDNESDFYVYSNPSEWLGPGESTTFELTFDPASVGQRLATVVIAAENPSQADFTFAISGMATDLSVQSVQVNSGQSSRSQLDSVKVLFNQLIDHQSVFEAFEIRNLTLDQLVSSVIATPSDVEGQTEVLLTFESRNFGPIVLDDGNYELRVRGGMIRSQGTDPYPMLDDYFFGTSSGAVQSTDAFFRLFGDSDGDRDVDTQDWGRFGLTFMQNESSLRYNRQLDVDRDGDVDGIDYSEFRLRFLHGGLRVHA